MSDRDPVMGDPAAITAAQWRQIVDSAADTAIISTDPQGYVTSWNEGARRILGWTETEMLGHTLDRIFLEEDRAAGKLGQEMAKAAALGRGGGEEGWRLRKDGNRFWAEGEIMPILGESNLVGGFIKIVRDRTAQREAEDIIHEERRALTILNRAGSALTVENDLKKLVQIVTDAGVEITRAEFGAFFYGEKDQFCELYALSGAHPDAFKNFPMPRASKLFAATFNGEGIVRSGDIATDPRYGENPPYHGMPTGHLPVRSYLAVPVTSRSGGVLGMLLFGHGQPNMFSEQSERGLTGLAAEAAVAIDNVRLTQEALKEIAERKRAEDALRDLNATLEQQVVERTRELRKNEEALRQAQKMEAVGQLTGGVAHDFNNLLQVIIGNLEIIQMNPSVATGSIKRAVTQAMNGALRGASLTRRLLAFSRRQPLDPKPIDVNALVSGTSELLRRTLNETIIVDALQRAGLWRVEADQAELEAAILNLAVNARDAMPNGGRLTVRTANVSVGAADPVLSTELKPGDYVEIQVIDSGSGMDANTLDQAFEPFFTTKPVGRGSGLGLSQVYGFVRQSGGHVRIDSKPMTGTTVSIYLPRYEIEFETVEPASAPIVPTAKRNEMVLVVEDDADVRSYSVDMLRRLGYRVMHAADGPSALQSLQLQEHVDLLFTDVVLPNGMTGDQVAARAREMQNDLKVLFTTGYARNTIMHDGRLDKGVQLITKPFNFADLARKIREVLDGAAA